MAAMPHWASAMLFVSFCFFVRTLFSRSVHILMSIGCCVRSVMEGMSKSPSSVRMVKSGSQVSVKSEDPRRTSSKVRHVLLY